MFKKRQFAGCWIVQKKDKPNGIPRVLIRGSNKIDVVKLAEVTKEVPLSRLEVEKDENCDAAALIKAFIKFDECLYTHFELLLTDWIFKVWKNYILDKKAGRDPFPFSTAEEIQLYYGSDPLIHIVSYLLNFPHIRPDMIFDGLLGLARCIQKNVDTHWETYRQAPYLKKLAKK